MEERTMTRKKPVFICGGDFTPEERGDCPNPVHNWPLAKGYIDASGQADRRIRTGWGNPKCPTCGLYGWTPGKLHDTDTISLPPKED